MHYLHSFCHTNDHFTRCYKHAFPTLHNFSTHEVPLSADRRTFCARPTDQYRASPSSRHIFSLRLLTRLSFALFACVSQINFGHFGKKKLVIHTERCQIPPYLQSNAGYRTVCYASSYCLLYGTIHSTVQTAVM